MTDIEIDKALALAIGYTPNNIQATIVLWVFHNRLFHNRHSWRVFSHRDWNVIGPIAARYNCFPFEDAFGRWFSDIGTNGKKVGSYTPQRAIALAVIGAQHGTKT